MENNLNKDDDDDDLLTFSLACNRRRESPQRQMQIPLTAASNMDAVDKVQVNDSVAGPSRPRRARSRSFLGTETITPPFPWATNRRATVHSFSYLLDNKIVTIKGNVECKRCKIRFEMSLDLKSNLFQLLRFIQNEKETMHDRAPKVWMQPVLPKCNHCGQENSVQPYLADTKKKNINWLFLFLAEMLGCCTLKQLQYFLKHTKMHRTGAKDRVLYSTYMGLLNQLVPDWSAST